jgi:hypothetical protein
MTVIRDRTLPPFVMNYERAGQGCDLAGVHRIRGVRRAFWDVANGSDSGQRRVMIQPVTGLGRGALRRYGAMQADWRGLSAGIVLPDLVAGGVFWAGTCGSRPGVSGLPDQQGVS